MPVFNHIATKLEYLKCKPNKIIMPEYLERKERFPPVPIITITEMMTVTTLKYFAT